MDFPSYESYEDFDQLENGIGMCRLLLWETEKYLSKYKNVKPSKNEVTIVTGKAAYEVMLSISKKIMETVDIEIHVEKINNNFFGEKITVSGLTTGRDIIEQLRGRNLKNIILPGNMFNDNNVMLDDMTVDDLRRELASDVKVCDVDGEKLIKSIIEFGGKNGETNRNNSRKA
jgi:NifB/MoaA-like Fe-S oxidoreductase